MVGGKKKIIFFLTHLRIVSTQISVSINFNFIGHTTPIHLWTVFSAVTVHLSSGDRDLISYKA